MEATNKSLAKGLLLLRAFNRLPRPTLAELSRATGLPSVTALRYMQTLIDEGYVVVDPQTRRYSLKAAVLELGLSALASMGLPQRVQPDLQALAQQAGGAAQLAVLDGIDAIILVRALPPEGSRRFIGLNVHIGMRVPAHATGVGRSLLAQDAAALEAALQPGNLPRLTARTITDPERLRATVEAERRRGYSCVQEELALGYSSIGAPIGEDAGSFYAIGVTVNPDQVDEAAIHGRLAPLLLKTAAEIRRATGRAAA